MILRLQGWIWLTLDNSNILADRESTVQKYV